MESQHSNMGGEGISQDGDVTPTHRRNTTETVRLKKMLGQSGTSFKEPVLDDSTHYATDDEYSFLASVSN